MTGRLDTWANTEQGKQRPLAKTTHLCKGNSLTDKVANAHHWFGQAKSVDTFAGIATAAKTSN